DSVSIHRYPVGTRRYLIPGQYPGDSGTHFPDADGHRLFGDGGNCRATQACSRKGVFQAGVISKRVIISPVWVALAAVPLFAFRSLKRAPTSPSPLSAVHVSR